MHEAMWVPEVTLQWFDLFVGFLIGLWAVAAICVWMSYKKER